MVSSRFIDDSTFVKLVSTVRNRIGSWILTMWRNSTTAVFTDKLTSGEALPRRCVRIATCWTTDSLFYQWFTKESENQVVVNIEESHVISPFVSTLVRLWPVVERAWYESYTSRITTQFRACLAREPIVESRIGRLLGSVDEAPERLDEDDS